MSWGMVAVAAATVVGAVINSNSNKESSKAQQASQREAMSVEERMFQDSLELQQPYREAGYGALEGLQGMLDPEARGEMLTGYYESDEYAALSDQASSDILRTQGATGGLRSGASEAAIGQIAPQLGQQFMAGQQNRLTGIANMGMGAASQGAAGAQALGSSLGMRLGNIGQIQGQAAINQGNIYGQAAGTLGGMASSYFNNRGQGGGGNV